MNMKKSLSTALVPFVFIGTVVLSNNAMAVIDTSAVTTAISDAGTAVGVVGAAVLVLTVGIAVYKWLKRPLN